MQHTGKLTGMSGQLGQRARTNSEQLLSITRTHGEWTRDPERIRLTPGSVSITSGVWPDPETSIEPVYWGKGSNLFAYLVTWHRDGEQKHPTAAWIKDLVHHPGRVLFCLHDRKQRISVARVGGNLYGFDDLCTCADESCPLSGGLLTGTTITCQCHGSEFDIATGALVNGPAQRQLVVYDVEVVEGGIRIRATHRCSIG
ncbi:Rieske (2Fe-2S) protein [Streptomyces sp. NPDC048295]|uniref:Rieske (2Fe-2S) protein n=1 Tax=Streptomyces sp. NPDC048295 TaxID=3154617 RepID=UPI00342506F5